MLSLSFTQGELKAPFLQLHRQKWLVNSFSFCSILTYSTVTFPWLSAPHHLTFKYTWLRGAYPDDPKKSLYFKANWLATPIPSSTLISLCYVTSHLQVPRIRIQTTLQRGIYSAYHSLPFGLQRFTFIPNAKYPQLFKVAQTLTQLTQVQNVT